MKKKGITISSLIVYLVLFFLFTSFVVMVSSNINNKVFRDRASVQMQKNAAKTMTFFLNSAKNSADVNEIGNAIVFSNNDEYTYKENKLFKNDKIILRDLEKYEYSITDINETKKIISLKVKFKKYTKELEKTFEFTVGGGVYE